MLERMKRGLFFFFIVSLGLWSRSSAQEYGNEWVVPFQPYYKLTTAQNGIYRVSYSELLSEGFPANITLSEIQLWHRGNEQAIHIVDLNVNGVFDGVDYLEFYGKENDGALDSALYVSHDAHPNPYHNLYSDSTAYFLTRSLTQNGKRMEIKPPKVNVDGLPLEEFHIAESTEVFATDYSAGLAYPLGTPGAPTNLSAFDYGEGWTGARIREGTLQDIVFDGLQQIDQNGRRPVLEVLLAGRNNNNHNVIVSAGPNIGSLRTLKEVSFGQQHNYLVIDSLEWSDIESGSVTCRVFVDNRGFSDQISVSYARLLFPESLDQGSVNEKYYQIQGSVDESYIQIDNVPVGTDLYDLTDQDNVLQLEYNSAGPGLISTVISGHAKGRKLLMTSSRLAVPSIKQVFMRNIDPNVPDFVMITHPYLRTPTSNYQDVPMAYAAYRASEEGGGYDTLLVNIDQLYNLFTYGEKTSLAIYRFCKYLLENGDPEYLFIMGKGLTPNYNSHRQDFNAQVVRDLVPAAGYPGTDVIFSSGVDGALYEGSLPTGRMAANIPQELEAYFEKVKEMESQRLNDLWRKEILHLSGGKNILEQSLMRRYVDGFKSIAEGPMLGGIVNTNSKKTLSTEEIIDVSGQINSGKSLVTFFGHAATETTDFNIGFASNDDFGYENKGKYPVLLVNGCIAGDMYTTNSTKNFGEDWMRTPDRGAIGFIAHTGLGLSPQLKAYTDLFYTVAFADSATFGEGIGAIQKELGKRFHQQNSHSPLNISQIQQMALQGDPSIPLFSATIPDYEVSDENIFVQSPSGDTINVFTEKFNLGLVMKNFGAATSDSLEVVVSRSLSSGEVIQTDTLIIGNVLNKDTVYVEYQSVGMAGFGLNRFTVSVDPSNSIEELSKDNNYAEYEYYLAIGGTDNAFPYDFAVVNESNLKLIAQALDLLMEDRTYVFEIDTSADFSSEVMRTMAVDGNSMAKWQIDLFDNFPEEDTVVFYWNTRFENPRADELNLGDTSSFIYIKDGSTGWGMAQFPQFEKTELSSIVRNELDEEWEFEKSETFVGVRTFGDSHPDLNANNVQLFINQTQHINSQIGPCTNNSINMVAFRKTSTVPYLALGSPFILDRKSCGGWTPQFINNMIKDEIESQLRIESYIDAVDDGDFVLLFSMGTVTYQSWPISTTSKLEEIGVNLVDLQGIANGEPLIILGKKGAAPGYASVIRADYSDPTPADEQEISLDDVINGQAVRGTISSPKIGPASAWKSFHPDAAFSGDLGSGWYTFSVYGIDSANNEDLLFKNILDVDVDLQLVNAEEYPFIRLEMETFDAVNLSPAQLLKWIVNYEGVPEGILSLKEGEEIVDIEKVEGESYEVLFAFENLSNLDFLDSIPVEYTIFNFEQRASYVDTVMIKPLAAGEAADVPLQIETAGKPGLNDLRVFANPYALSEQNYNNNFINIAKHLNVITDNTNPILEVTVDGQFIGDGDIVAPSPVILLRLMDENSVLYKTDTLGVHMYLSEKCEVAECEETRISLSSPLVQWTPASESSDFIVEFRPEQLADGLYTLKAQAADASGNRAGAEYYEVSFEVINESQITHFVPFPNPFSTHAKFAYTLTGSEVPDEVLIQIMTLNGSVVREIDQDELGPLKIGEHQTEFAWDGRDQYGNQLASGIYVYKVRIFNNGEEMVQQSTSADKAFRNGVGKMYLVR